MIELIKTDTTRSALLLVRTPLQAWIAEQVLLAEGVSNYDLVYFTQQDAPEDRYYFSRLSASADKATYCFAPVRRFDIWGHLNFRHQASAWYRDQRHDLTLMASVNAHVLSAISSRQRSSELVTFDDGLANIMPQGMFHVDCARWRSRIYRWLLGASELATTKNRIVRHYTLYPEFDNIVEPERRRNLDGWSQTGSKLSGGDMRTYFVGQPFEEAMEPNQIRLLEAYARTLNIDFYVKHPRERKLLDIGAPLLNKGGRIAEDAIAHDAGAQPIHVIGWFSTVLFNLGRLAQRRTVLLPDAHPNLSKMTELAQRAGCEIILL